MRRLIVDMYRLIFRATGIKFLALVISLLYMTVLNLVMIYGLGLLMEGLFPFMSVVHKMFAFPYILATSVGVLLVTLWLMPSVSSITKEGKKAASPLALILYTIFSLMLFAYISLGDRIF